MFYNKIPQNKNASRQISRNIKKYQFSLLGAIVKVNILR